MLNLLIKPAWLLVENQVQNQVGHAAMGTYLALLSLASILGAGVDLGLGQYTAKHLARMGKGSSSQLPVVLPLKWILTFLFPCLLLGVGWLLGYPGQELHLLLVIAGGFAFSQFLAFLRAMLQGLHHFRADAWVSVSERLLQLVLVAGLLGAGLSLETFVYSRTGAIVLAFGAGLLLIRLLLGKLRYELNWGQVRQVLRGSLPFALIMLVYGMNERVDLLMLEQLSSKAETGLYGAAYRWVDAAMMYLWLVLPIFFARFAASIGDKPGLQLLLRQGQVLVSAPLIFLSVFVLFYGQLLFWQFENSTARELEQMQLNLVILFGHVALQGLFALYSTLLTAGNQEKYVSKLVLMGVIANVMLNSFFIPEYGSAAAAASTLCCSALLSAGYLFLVHRKTGLQLPFDLLGKLALSAGLLAGVFKLLLYGPLDWYWNAGLAAGGYLGILGVLRVLPSKVVLPGRLRFREDK